MNELSSGLYVAASLEWVRIEDYGTVVTGISDDSQQQLDVSPDRINYDPYGNGWLSSLQPNEDSELKSLMSTQDYSDSLDES